MEQKYCINCANMERSTQFPNDLNYARCTAAGVISLVDGKRPLVFCSSARSMGGACGEEAKLFQPNRTPDFRDGRNPKYDDDWGDGRTDTAPDGRLLKDVHNG